MVFSIATQFREKPTAVKGVTIGVCVGGGVGILGVGMNGVAGRFIERVNVGIAVSVEGGEVIFVLVVRAVSVIESFVFRITVPV